jgi:hypothetical protein
MSSRHGTVMGVDDLVCVDVRDGEGMLSTTNTDARVEPSRGTWVDDDEEDEEDDEDDLRGDDGVVMGRCVERTTRDVAGQDRSQNDGVTENVP